MTLFSEIRGLPVLTLTDAAELGAVTSLAVDAGSGAVTHLRLRGRRPRRETVLPWAALHAVGPDAVLVRSAGPADPVPPPYDPVGSRVLTDAGDERGTVRDIAFDPDTGRVLTVVTALGDIPAERLLGLGDYALVVRAG
ncbi:PRC-barrel domain-containing protein [Streptomyces sp. ISL-12]|uniref:PRC-barrel domain-containing protein n=1 Tax=Streptomyces sp. ISL-12 TaxID=2819177 RepID=UPI001BEA2C08|nr:PRC-barrel domain-containing protein [Streptomyces sp. ISL-12]MBT2411408.1 PRC-barrel domain-containing protein [Streptomyces sp. ISL-12]